ncbi:MAG: ATP-binding protein [Bauldia sp.]
MNQGAPFRSDRLPNEGGGDLAAALRRLEALSAAKSRMLATVSHEIRTPLSGILGLAGVLLGTPLSDEQRTFVRALHTSGELLMGLVDDLLDFAKIEAGGFKLAAQPTDCAAVVQEIVELLAPRAHAKGIDIAGYVSAELPPELRLDAARLRQVLLNLAGNAVKFTETGGVGILVAPDEDGPPGRVVFAVVDSGPGIAPGEAERLFAGLGPADAPSPDRARGSGLGLPISREIVRRMGGDIELRARPGGGTEFRFALESAATAATAKASRPLAGRRALILAPEGAAPAILARQLAELGVEAKATDSLYRAKGAVAAAAAAGLAYDFALVDPRGTADPSRLLGELTEAAGGAMPTVALIEPGRRRDIEPLRQAGYLAYLVRPVRRASLVKIATALAAGSRQFRADPSDEPQAEPPRAALGRRKLNVLLAEDDEINALLLRAVLERSGHNVTEARDGRAAVTLATADDGAGPDALLLDLHLPLLDGIGIAEALRRHAWRGPPPPMIAVTADASDLARAEARAAGFACVLEKPVDPQLLARVLDELALDREATG